MTLIQSIFPISRATASIIITSCVLFLSIVLTSIDIWGIVRLTNYMEGNCTDDEVTLRYSLDENYTVLTSKHLETMLKLFIFMLIFHLKEVFLNIFLLYSIINNKTKHLIIWLLGNALRVLCISALLFYLTAVFLSLLKKKYQIYASIVAVFGTIYVFLQYKFSRYIYDLYVYSRQNSLTRLRFKNSQSSETINISINTIYGTPCDNHSFLNIQQESQIKV